MADYKKLIPFILKWEGGFVNDPDDAGGATNKGVTIATYETYCRKKGYPKPTIERLKNLTDKEWEDIFKTLFWDRWKADQIANQSIANILVDWLWASGVYGIKLPQKTLGVSADGLVGSKTLEATNKYPDQQELFDNIKADRIAYIDRIIQNRPTNKKFRNGWMNRINDLKFEV